MQHLLAPILGLALLPLQAQVFPKTQDLQFWDGATLVSVEGLGSVRVAVGPKGRKPKQEFDLPAGFTRPDFFNGFFRAQELESLPNGEKNWKLHSSTDGLHWNLEGHLPIEQRGIVRIHAVGDGKYLLALLGLGSSIIRSPRALVIVSARLGYLWILDTDKESPSLNLTKVFPSLTEARFQSPDRMETVVLGIQPRPDGHFLLATRSEKAVLAALDDVEAKSISMQDALDAAARDARSKLQQARLQAFPEILWWDLDPANGKFTREEPPPGLPDKLLDSAMLRKFCFRFGPAGSVEGFY